jgi:CubicO group peptidase (beta-lactamase class C family)
VRRHVDPQRDAVTVSEQWPLGTVTDPDRLADALAGLLQRTVARSPRIRHGLLGVARTDGTFRWTGAAGVAREDGAAVTPVTPYPIASITKLYTATAVLLLHERGRLALTDRMVDHLPAPLVDRLHVVDGMDRTGEITVRHLLAQTSGLPDFYEAAPEAAAASAPGCTGGRSSPSTWRRCCVWCGRSCGPTRHRCRRRRPDARSGTATPTISCSGRCSSRSPVDRCTRPSRNCCSPRSD